MKPLFGIDLTENKYNSEINSKHFTVATTPEEKKQKHDEYHMLLKIISRNMKLPRAFKTVKKIARLLAIAIILGILRPMVGLDKIPLSQIFERAPYAFYIGGACLLIWWIIALAEIIKQKTALTPGAKKKFEEFMSIKKEIYDELGVPEGTEFTDILVFQYIMKDGVPVAQEMGKHPTYRNIETKIFSDGVRLCIVDILARVEIPLNSIRAIRTVNTSIEIPRWNKKEPFTSPKYKQYNISANKSGIISSRPYHILEFEIDGETWGLHFPCYELPTFEALTYVTADKA